MKIPGMFRKLPVAAMAFLLLGCGAETIAAIIFIPAFSATWPVQGDPEYFIDLRNADQEEDVPSGPLTGFEDHDSDPARQLNDLVGSFNGLDIEFTILRNNGQNPIKYTGKMIPVSDENHAIVRIELNSSEGPLVLGN